MHVQVWLRRKYATLTIIARPIDSAYLALRDGGFCLDVCFEQPRLAASWDAGQAMRVADDSVGSAEGNWRSRHCRGISLRVINRLGERGGYHLWSC